MVLEQLVCVFIKGTGVETSASRANACDVLREESFTC